MRFATEILTLKSLNCELRNEMGICKELVQRLRKCKAKHLSFFSCIPTCLNWSVDLIWTWYTIFVCICNTIPKTLLDISFYIHFYLFFEDNEINVKILNFCPPLFYWSFNSNPNKYFKLLNVIFNTSISNNYCFMRDGPFLLVYHQ